MHRTLSRAALAVIATLLLVLGIAPTVQADPGDVSNSESQFLSGSLLPLDLSSVAGIEGADATYTEQSPAQPADVESEGLDIEVLSLLQVDLGGGISLPLGQLLALGAVNQYAEAGPDGVSRAASGAVSNEGAVDTTGTGAFPANAELDLTQLLGDTPLLSEASLSLGGVTGVAALDGQQLADGTPLATSCADLSAPTHCRDYNITDASLNLTSPAVGDLVTTVDGALVPVQNGVNGLGDVITQGLLDGVLDSLDLLGSLVPGLSVGSNTLAVDVNANLQGALDPVLNQTLDSGEGVQINLQTGEITVDLAQIVDLNNLPPNSSLLSEPVLSEIAAQVDTLLDALQVQINDAIEAAVNNVNVQISGGVCLLDVFPTGSCSGLTDAGLNISYNGSLGALLNNTQDLTVSGTGLLGAVLNPILTPLVDTIQGALGGVVTPVLNGILDTAGSTVATAVSTLAEQITPLLNVVAGVADVQINVQEENADGDGTFTEVAVRVDLLGSDLTRLDLGKAVVGPNLVNQYDPTLTASDAPSGGESAVTGGGWPPNTEVSLQLTGPDGSPVGDPVVVTTDAQGNLPGGTTVPVPAGAAPGEYTVVGTTPGGLTASAPLTVTDGTAPDAPVITSPTDGSTTGTTPTYTGTAEPGSTVTVIVDGEPVGTTTADDNGDWSFTQPDPLAEGEHTVTATATDTAGNVSPEATPVTWTVDGTAPDAPVITSPTDGSSTNDPTPPITGTADPGTTVDVTITHPDGSTEVIEDVPVDENGDWTVTPDTPLPEGDNTITATATDPAGNTSEPSAPVTVTIDTTAPGAPVIETIDGEPATDGPVATNDDTPAITGSAEPGTTVDLSIDGAVVAEDLPVDENGQWTYTPTTPLGEGSHEISATQTDEAGNTSPADTATVVVDTTAPDAPVITSPGDGDVVGDSTPPITGTAEPNATVEVIIDGTPVGTTTADADGNWTYVPTTALTDGEHTVSATQTDPAGNTSPESAPVTFTVDTEAPAAPVIETIDGDPADATVHTSDPTPAITGSAEPGSTVDLTIDGEVVAEDLPVADDGTWSYTPQTAYAEGQHEVSATQTDAAGNTSPADTATFVVDTTTPDAPVITGPSDGSTIGDTTPTITGTGEPGATVDVVIDGTSVGTTTVDPDGTWSLEVPEDSPLTEGPHTVVASQTDPAGNTSPDSEPVDFTVDTSQPAPVITSPTSGSSTNDTTPTIAGTGEPGGTITVTTADGTVLGTATVDENGDWTLDSVELEPGTYTIHATETDELGNVSPESNTVIFTVDTAAPEPPVITSPSDGDVLNDTTPTVTGTAEPGSTVTVIIDGEPVGETTADVDGNWSFTVPDDAPLTEGDHTITATATDEAGNTSEPSAPVDITVDTTAPEPPVITSPADGSSTNDSTPTISGTGVPGSTVEVTVDDQVIGTTTVDGDGSWTIDVPDGQALADGDHTVTATQTDEAGNTSEPSAPVGFTVDTDTPDAPVITGPADGDVVDTATPEITGTAEPGSTVTVIVDGEPIGTTTADENGDWSLTPTEPLTDGPHEVTATATDEAGNTSEPSAPVGITVDTTAPEPPVITGPADGTVTNDNTPTITGTAEGGSTVTVIVDGVPIGTTTADQDGNWSFTVPDDGPLPDGDHTITATATDEAGNTSEPSAPVGITVDAEAPPTPVVTSPADDSLTNNPTPPITGTGEPNTTVDVTITHPDGSTEVIEDVPVDENGDWTVTPTQPLPDGANTIVVVGEDEAGNRSDPSEPVTVVVDTEPPATPVVTSPTDGSATNDDTPPITGTGDPGTTVDVTITHPDGSTEVIEDVPVDENGDWSVTPTEPLPEGENQIVVVGEDEAGNTSEPSEPVTVVVDTDAPDAPVITAPTDGSTVGTGTPTITGTGEPGATVEVTIDGEVVGTTTVDTDGTWSFTPSEPLDDGEHTVSATQTDPAGNTSPVSDEVTFEVDTTSPSPAITHVDDQPVGDRSDPVLTNDPTPVFAGTTEPGSTVTVEVTDDTGEVVATGEATVNDDGSWTFTPSTPLPDGAYTAVATANDGTNPPVASQPVQVVVDTVAETPVVTSPSDGSATNDDTPPITGTGDPGGTVDVVITHPDGTETTIEDVPVDENGDWSVTPTEPLPEGENEIVVIGHDPAGNTSEPSEPVRIVVDTQAPDAPVITSPSDGDTVRTSTPPITGTAEPGATVEVTIDGRVVGTTTADDNGEWTFTPSTPLSNGPHTVRATQTDAAGNRSPASAPVRFTVDTSVPAPVITNPQDGDEVDPTPTVEGRGETGAQVDVYVNGHHAGSATADGGQWSVDVGPLRCGKARIQASQTVEGRGNARTSVLSDAVTVRVVCADDGGAGNGGGSGNGAGDESGNNAGGGSGYDSGDGSDGVLPETGMASGMGLVGALGLIALAIGVFMVRRGRREA